MLGAHQHVESEDSSVRGPGTILLQDEFADHEMAPGKQGPGAALNQGPVFVFAEHVTNGGEQHQVEALAKVSRAHVPGPDADAVLQARRADVVFCQWHHRPQIQDFCAQFGTRLGKGDGKGA